MGTPLKQLSWLALALGTLLASSASNAAPVVWAFEGWVTALPVEVVASGERTGSVAPPGVEIGSRFSGSIHFNEGYFGPTTYQSIGTVRSFAWTQLDPAIALSLEGFDFSVGGADSLLQLTLRDDEFASGVPGDHLEDAVIFTASADGYFDPDTGDVGDRRGIQLYLEDFDQSLLSSVELPLVPPDIRDLERAMIGAGLFSTNGDWVRFIGTIDHLVAIPEPASCGLLAAALAAICVRRRSRTRGPANRSGERLHEP